MRIGKKINAILNKSWLITLSLRFFIQNAKALSKWPKNIKAAIKDITHFFIFHLYLYVNQHPKLMRAVVFALARFPNIQTRLKEIINVYISSSKLILVTKDPVDLSPRARIIYDDLQAKIEGWQKDRN